MREAGAWPLQVILNGTDPARDLGALCAQHGDDVTLAHARKDGLGRSRRRMSLPTLAP